MSRFLHQGGTWQLKQVGMSEPAWFPSLEDAWSKIEAWQRDCNEISPHSALG